MALDKNRLAKLLTMMRSPVDQEVLTAARAAVRMVSEAGEAWSDVIGAVPAHRPDYTEELVEHPALGFLAPPVGLTWNTTFQWLCANRFGRNDRENENFDNIYRRISQAKPGSDRSVLPSDAAAAVAAYQATVRGNDA